MALAAAFAPMPTFSRLRIEQKRLGTSNARPTIGVCDHKLGGITRPCPGIPTARLAGLSKRLPVPSRMVIQGNLLKRNRLGLSAWQIPVPLSGCQRVDRKGRGNSRYGLDTAWSKGSWQAFLESHDPSESESPAADMNSDPSEPLEKDLNEDRTRGSIFESPRHLEELKLPEETKRFIRVLRNPYEGSLVYLIGTAHVSEASANDVMQLIQEVRPDAVAVELDEESLERFERGLTEVANFPIRTTWEVLKILRTHFSGDFSKLWSTYHPSFLAQTLGVPYVCDVRSAIYAAAQVGARVLPIDQPTAITDFRNEETAEVLKLEEASLSKEERVSRRTATKQLLKAQFEGFSDEDQDTETAAQAFGRTFTSFITGQPAPLEDIEIFQSAENKTMEAGRLQGVKGVLMPAFDEKEGPNQNTALIHERDRFMGLKLACIAAEYTKVVAVVGAAHVPGITTRFAQYTAEYCNPLKEAWQERLEETRVDTGRRGAESLHGEDGFEGGAPNIVGEPGRKQQEPEEQQKTGKDIPGLQGLRQGIIFAAAAGVGGFACYKWPILAAELGLGAFTAHGVLMVGLAAFTANWAQFGAYLEAASIELRSEK